ncbi:MAG: DUF3418 domain-containing protein, partial [Planctomycetales bacterium]|nr:DUF3418 domain-containing protein [Planctomycetales bacterium]
MREWTEIHRQLMDVAQQQGFRQGQRHDDFAAIHRALLTGLLSGVAYKTGDREYTGAGGLTFSPWPGSGLVRERHAWIMAAERIETAKRYGRTLSRVSPVWVEQLAEHLVKRSYSDPHWRKKLRTVMAYEKVSLWGMPIVVKRSVRYGPLDPETARQIFIQQALVDGNVNDFDSFVTQNRALREEIAELAAKTRRRDLLLDDYTIYMFYDERLPHDVFDVASMLRWLKASPDHRQRVRLKFEDLVQEQVAERSRTQFPDELTVGNLVLPVAYHFEAGADDDGVTISVPAAAVHQLDPRQLDWLVPGLIEEKVVALMRSLPKALRRNFVPVPDTARQIVSELDFGNGTFLDVLAQKLSQYAQERVAVADFDLDKLPTHLRMNVKVLDDDGQAVHAGRDLNELQRENRQQQPDATADVRSADPRWARDGITDWDFGELPKDLILESGGIPVTVHPAVVDQGESVSLRLMDTQSQADRATRRGVSRLYYLANRKSLKTQIRWLPQWNECCVWAADRIDVETLKHDLQMRIAELAFVGREKLPRDEAEFRRRQANGVERIGIATQEVAPLLPRMFAAYHRVRLALDSIQGTRYQAACFDINEQLDQLFVTGFLVDAPWPWLQEFPRYLEAIVYRIDKL